MINIRIQKLLTEHCKHVVSPTTKAAKRGENETHRKIKERGKKKAYKMRRLGFSLAFKDDYNMNGGQIRFTKIIINNYSYVCKVIINLPLQQDPGMK